MHSTYLSERKELGEIENPQIVLFTNRYSNSVFSPFALVHSIFKANNKDSFHHYFQQPHEIIASVFIFIIIKVNSCFVNLEMYL